MLRSLGRLAARQPRQWWAQAAAAADGCSTSRTLSAAADSSAGGSGGDRAELERKKVASKLLYRARQRGFLELDLLVGLWAEQEVPRMDAAALQQFAAVLDQENPDLFKWLTGQAPAPAEMAANDAYRALAAHVAQQLADHAPQAAQAAAGKEWVRGWDDGWKQQSTPAAAATASGEAGQKLKEASSS